MAAIMIKTLLMVAILHSIHCAHQYSYKNCHPKCGKAPWHIAGRCNRETGRCLCYYGWTGPNSGFRKGTLNKIEADYCTEACHYTHHHRNTRCTYQNKKPRRPIVSVKCSKLCGHLIFHQTGKCMKDVYGRETGKCLCWWGWTGPGSRYRSDGRIMAEYCVLPCHYSTSFRNEYCESK